MLQSRSISISRKMKRIKIRENVDLLPTISLKFHGRKHRETIEFSDGSANKKCLFSDKIVLFDENSIERT